MNLTVSSTAPKGWKLAFVVNKDNMYQYWKGDSEGHAKAGRKGGLNQGKHSNSGNFANDKAKARRAGKKSKRAKRPLSDN